MFALETCRQAGESICSRNHGTPGALARINAPNTESCHLRLSSFPISLMYPSRVAPEGVLHSIKPPPPPKKQRRPTLFRQHKNPGNTWWQMAACVYRKYTTVGCTCATHTTTKKSEIIGCGTVGDPRDYGPPTPHPATNPFVRTSFSSILFTVQL